MRAFKVFIAAMVAVSVLTGAFAAPAAAATGDVVGTVTDDVDEPLEGVDVTLVNESDGTNEAVTTTDANGNYSFANVSDGNYTVEVEKTGFGNDSKSVTHDSTTETRADFSLTSTMPEYHNATYSVDEDDERVYVDIDDTNGTDVYVYFSATENSTGNETHISREVVNTDGTIASVNVTVDAANYSDYTVTVEGNEEPASISSGTVSKLDGGGGGTNSLTSSTFGIPNWIGLGVIVLLVGIALGSGKV